MKVAIDIRHVRDFGAGTYTRNLVTQLARLDRETTYLLAGTYDDRAELGELGANFSLLEWPRGQEGGRHDLRLGLRLRRAGVQVLHSPYLAAPTLMLCPRVVTVHDVINFLDLTDGQRRVRDAVRFQLTRLCLSRARRILAVSRATKEDLQRVFSLPGQKIEVVYNALDARLAQPPSLEMTERTLTRYSVHSPYLLYAGNVKPHKNLPRLIEAFAVVKDELREDSRYRDLKLIIIGDELSKHPQLRHAVIQSRTQSDVRFLGFVDPQTLSVFYARASAFVFPSLYEGFGLPPLEAMAMGAPVVTSNVSSLPEVLGEAAQFVNPENVFDISRGIKQVLLDDELRRQLIERGHERVQQFSWERSVERVLEIYREVAA